MVRTLLTSRTIPAISYTLHVRGGSFAVPLTARENHPNEVHEEVVSPEVQKLGSRVRDLRVVVIEHAGCVVENQAVDLAHADDDLEGVAERVRVCDEEGYDETDRAPCELSIGPSN
jgi:hypothetical protein